jgi:hypothetical protein
VSVSSVSQGQGKGAPTAPPDTPAERLACQPCGGGGGIIAHHTKLALGMDAHTADGRQIAIWCSQKATAVHATLHRRSPVVT